MSQRDIAEQIKALYDVDISPELVSKISEKIMPEVTAWQNRPLEAVYPFVFLDAMLPNSPHVKEVVCGSEGVLEGARPDTIVIDMSSIAPQASIEIGKACAEKGVKMVDAPVSGGEPKAIDRSLSIMVGGGRAVFDDVYKILMAMGAAWYTVGT